MSQPASDPALLLEPPALQAHLVADDSFAARFLRALAAIAASDRVVNLAEYEALSAVVERLQHSALAARLVLHSLTQALEPAAALRELQRASAAVEESLRLDAFEAAAPLLALQGERSQDFARSLADALGLRLDEGRLSAFEAGPQSPFWRDIAGRSARRLRGRDLLPLASECLRLSGDPELARARADYLDGAVDRAQLQSALAAAGQALDARLLAFETGLGVAAQAGAIARQYLAVSERLIGQVRQKLAMLLARIDHEKQVFDEDFDEMIHDAGNAFELAVASRLRTDDWKDRRAWQDIGRSAFGRELERRVDRIARRHERQLHLLKEELRLFQEDLRLVNASVLERQHHSRLARLAPGLRPSTQLVNAVEGVANFTLAAGGASALGAGAAAYLLGGAVVLPLVAPIAPYVGGAVLLAGVFRWLTDQAGRRDGEISHQREAFEKALRERLGEARASYFAQLEQARGEFIATARALIAPLGLEAEAARDLAEVRHEVARRILADTRRSLGELNQAMARLPAD
ncbi:MAG: hypothetical protein WCG13_05765 [Burkholderiales bacterium]